jgi:serine/threonine protein phosphatase PrpC
MKNIIFVLATSFSSLAFCSNSSTEEFIYEPTLFYQVGHYSLQNACTGRFAHSNEDRFVAQSIKFLSQEPDESAAVFGVFDGHGTGNVSEFLKNHFVNIFVGAAFDNPNITQALNNTFMSVDRLARALTAKQGSTAAVAVILGKKIYLANAGDSAVIMMMKRENQYYYYDTNDHKPLEDKELERILRAGGIVTRTGPVARLGGNLSLSRSIGDHPKEIGLIATPEINYKNLDQSFQTLILVSDGVTDKLSRGEIMNIALDVFYEEKSAEDAARKIVEEARLKGSKDDITALVVRFLWEDEEPMNATQLLAPFSQCNAQPTKKRKVEKIEKVENQEKVLPKRRKTQNS